MSFLALNHISTFCWSNHLNVNASYYIYISIYIYIFIYTYDIYIYICVCVCASGSSIDFRLEVCFSKILKGLWHRGTIPGKLGLTVFFKMGSFDISGTSDRPGDDRRSLQLCEGSLSDPSTGFWMAIGKDDFSKTQMILWRFVFFFTLWWTNILLWKMDRNSGFSHEQWGFSIAKC